MRQPRRAAAGRGDAERGRCHRARRRRGSGGGTREAGARGPGDQAIARCLRDQGLIREAIESYAKAMEIWMDKSLDEQMKEMPEVPSKDRQSPHRGFELKGRVALRSGMLLSGHAALLYACMQVYVCMYVCMYVGMYVCMYVCR